jgi:hypothetical protein
MSVDPNAEWATSLARGFMVGCAAQGFDFGNIERQMSERNKVPIRVPVTSIYSKSDGVVASRATIDPVNRHFEHVEVRESHFSLGFSSRVFRILAERLAR